MDENNFNNEVKNSTGKLNLRQNTNDYEGYRSNNRNNADSGYRSGQNIE